MIEPIKYPIIQNFKNEIVKYKEKQISEKDRYREIQNKTESKGKYIDKFA